MGIWEKVGKQVPSNEFHMYSLEFESLGTPESKT